jgi:hypothetical protein
MRWAVEFDNTVEEDNALFRDRVPALPPMVSD